MHTFVTFMYSCDFTKSVFCALYFIRFHEFAEIFYTIVIYELILDFLSLHSIFDRRDWITTVQTLLTVET